MQWHSKTTILLLTTSLWSAGCLRNLDDDEEIFRGLPVTQEPYNQTSADSFSSWQRMEQERQQREQREREWRQRARQNVREVALTAVYEVFELDGNENINVAALKRARKNMMRKWHPDKSTHARSIEITQVLNELWEKLEERYIANIHGIHDNTYWGEIQEICERYQGVIEEVG